MKKIKLQTEELEQINAMISEYRRIEDNLSGIQRSLEILEKEKEQLLSSLDKNRENEINFFNQIESKYGKGKFDLHTKQYILTE